mgnify:CR=1 FL=1
MFFKKCFNSISFMPSGAVYINPYGISFKPIVKLAQYFNKSFTVAFQRFNHPVSANKRSYPSRYIQTKLMLAGSWDTKTLSLFSPSSAKAWMERKTSLILEYYRFFRLQRFEFFLTSTGTSAHPLPSPEDMNNRPFSSCNQVDASNIEPDELLSLSQNYVSNMSRALAHPIGRAVIQAQRAFFQGLFPVDDGHLELSEQDAPASVWALGIQAPAYLPYVSRELSSDATGPISRLSIPDADPPVSAEEPLFLFQYRLPEYPERRLKDALDSLLDWLILLFGFSCLKRSTRNTICQFI